MVAGKNEPAGEGLPDGWLKECRPRKNRHGSRMGDTFYIDPVHGYEFQSLKDVYRYLQSGDISQCAKLPSKRKTKDLHSAGGTSHCAGRPSDGPQLDTPKESDQYKCGSSKPDNINRVTREYDQIGASEVRGVQSGSEEHIPGKAESVARKGASVEQRTKDKKRKAKPIKQLATPLRSSPRLAALKLSQEVDNASKDGPANIQTDTTSQSQPMQVKIPRRKADSSVLPEKKDGTSSLSEKTEDNYCSVPNETRSSVPCSSADVGCQNALAGVPVSPQQSEQNGTTASMPGAALSSLFRHVWSDPCLQFAFRTLIGDIPVFNDSLTAANYFLPQQQNLNKGATPNYSSSAYDGPRSHGQFDHVSLSMPRPSDKLYGSSWIPPQ